MMMENKSNITPISKGVVHRICSGQVILNLATAVKELVENSLDAGATTVDIRLKDFGSELVEVSDNGSGVHVDNFQALTLKHHTSKLQEFSDLLTVETFGFRGEALSSLCALSEVTVTTRHVTSQCGTRLTFNSDGTIVSSVPLARQVGTTVTLKNLFSTVPVRQKEFQRNLKREFAKMTNLLMAYCLVSTDVKITCTNQTKKERKSVVLATQSCKSVRENISCIFGAKQVTSLLEWKYQLRDTDKQQFELDGMISSCAHGSGRATTDRQFFYINSRPCEPSKIIRTINEVYHQFNVHQSPFVFLNIKTPRNCVDVNVTPDKRQIFLNRENDLLLVVKESLQKLYETIPSSYSMNNVMVCLTKKKVCDEMTVSPVNNDNCRPIFSKQTTSSSTSSQVVSNSGNRSSDDLIENSFTINGVSEDPVLSIEVTKDDNDDSFSMEASDTNKELLTNNIVNGTINAGSNTSVLTDPTSGCLSDNVESSGGNLNNSNKTIDCISKGDSTLNKIIFNQWKHNEVLTKRSADAEPSKSTKRLKQENLEKFQFNTSINVTQSETLQTTDDVDNTLSNKISVDTYKENKNTKNDNMIENEINLSSHEEQKILSNDVDVGNEKNTNNSIKIIDVSLENILKLQECLIKDQSFRTKAAVRFRALIDPTNNGQAEQELTREISKSMFSQMEVIGQFNLGFIIARHKSDLFIVDQHATDEKYNFEILQKNTTINSQRLVVPQRLELTSINEGVLIDSIEVFKANGFEFHIDENALPGHRVSLTTIPMSKNWIFGKEDIDELIFMLQDSPHTLCRPSRVRSMFASRACRKSVMIGTALTRSKMKTLLTHMGEIEQPWNCPHGRPTMRHLVNLDFC